MKKKITEYERAVADIYEAKYELQIAKNQFENVVDDFFELANAQLTLAFQKLDLAVKRARLLYK